MATAIRIRDDVGGFAGPATLYRIDPPIAGAEHLVVYYQAPMYGQEGQVCVLLATKNGACYTQDVRPQQGTYVTSQPDHALALQIAGGYQIVEETA